MIVSNWRASFRRRDAARGTLLFAYLVHRRFEDGHHSPISPMSPTLSVVHRLEDGGVDARLPPPLRGCTTSTTPVYLVHDRFEDGGVDQTISLPCPPLSGWRGGSSDFLTLSTAFRMEGWIKRYDFHHPNEKAQASKESITVSSPTAVPLPRGKIIFSSPTRRVLRKPRQTIITCSNFCSNLSSNNCR